MQFTVDRASQDAFARALRAIASYTNKEMAKLLKQLAIFAVQTARKVTPKGKKRRPVRKITGQERRKYGGKQYLIDIWNDGKPIPTGIDDRNDPLRRVKYAGAAKGSWTGVLKKLSAAEVANEEDTLAGVMMRGSVVTSNASGVNPWYLVKNRLEYISELVPDIESQAILSAENRLVNFYLAKFGDGIAATFER